MISLLEIADECRRNTLFEIYHAKSGHPGGSLSCVDLLVGLFSLENKANTLPDLKFILSKGHAAPALYAVAAEFGVLKKSELITFRKMNSKLQGHPHIGTTPWIGSSTGSLGQGFSVGIGMALGYRHKGLKHRVYALLGDGELQEGEIWEGAMSASHFKLDNFCAIVDYNKMQSDSTNAEIMALEPLSDKWHAFGWNVLEINGHNFDEIEVALNQANSCIGKPTVIIAHTTKGYGVSYMAGIPSWHGSVTLKKDELERALRDLNTSEDHIPQYINGSIWQS